jgi:hypothetical protein
MTARPAFDLFAERDAFGLPAVAGAVPDKVPKSKGSETMRSEN